MDDPGGTLVGMEPGAEGLDSVTSMESTVTAPAEPNRPPLARDFTFDSVDLGFLAPSNRSGSLGKIGTHDVYGVLGLGGMGIVLKAVDKALSRTVAVKVQNPLLALDSRSRGRFLKEARAVAAIKHPNVVTIYSVNVVRGRPYLVMEYLSGGSLRQRIKGGPPLAIPDIVRVGHQVTLGLAAAHERGLIHRDIKPANILLEGPNLDVKITDFGLAVTDPGVAVRASAGKIVGTPAYMSPEQIRGEPLDVRSDLFSLGAVFYAMVAGQSPFASPTSKESTDRVCTHEPEPLAIVRPGCCEAFSHLVARLLNKNPEERPGSAAEVAETLSRILSDETVMVSSQASEALRQAPEPLLSRPRRRNASARQILGVSAVVILMMGIVAGFAIHASDFSRVVLTVSQTSPASYPSLSEALKHAKPGNTIRLLDAQIYDGAILLNDSTRHRGLTIESSGGATLTAPGSEPSVVQIHGVSGVTLRNLTILTEVHQEGLSINGSEDGITLDRVRFIAPPLRPRLRLRDD